MLCRCWWEPIGNFTECDSCWLAWTRPGFSYCCLLIICMNCQYIFCFSLFYYIVIALLIFIAVSIVWRFSAGCCCQWQWQESCSPELLIYLCQSLFIEKSARLVIFSIFTFLNFPVDIVHNYVRILLAFAWRTLVTSSKPFKLWWQIISVTAGWFLWMNYRVQLCVLGSFNWFLPGGVCIKLIEV